MTILFFVTILHSSSYFLKLIWDFITYNVNILDVNIILMLILIWIFSSKDRQQKRTQILRNLFFTTTLTFEIGKLVLKNYWLENEVSRHNFKIDYNKLFFENGLQLKNDNQNQFKYQYLGLLLQKSEQKWLESVIIKQSNY
jgi:hypothetical protein